MSIALLEAVRRTTGIALPLIILFFVGVTLFQPYLPGLLYGQDYALDRLLYSAYVGEAGIYSVPVAVAASFLSRDRGNWMTPAKVLELCHQAVGRWVAIAAITAAVGIMIGALELSGVGIKISSFIIHLSGGDLVLTLVLVGFASLIVGMGLDAIPAYITLATLMAPALIDLGVPPIAAHLFVVYWGLASFFTPPMCIAVMWLFQLARAGCGRPAGRRSGWESPRS